MPSSGDDTGKLIRLAFDEVADVGAAKPVGSMTPDEFLEQLSSKVVEKANGKGPKFLGLDRDSWMKMILAWVVAAGLALGAWHLAVRDALQVRPTTPQVEHAVEKTFEHHNDSTVAHPAIQHRIDAMAGTQQAIRESQIRQEETDKKQTETLKMIQTDISRMRRNR